MFVAFPILLIFLHISNAKRDVVPVTQTFPNKKLVLSEASFDNETLVYALCDRPPKQCTIASVSNDYLNPNTCIVDVKADDVQSIIKFGKNKAILVVLKSTSKSTSMLQTITVHISSCKTVGQTLFEIPSNWKGFQLYRKYIDVVVFDDGFDVVVKGFSRICNEPNENKYCGFNFDIEGKRYGYPYVWPRIDYDSINVVSPILSDVSGKGYIFVHENASFIGVLVDREYSPLFTKLWGSQNISSDFSKGDQRADNNMMGACYAFDSNIKCWQNNNYGGFKMNTQFTFKHEHEVSNLHVYNLPEGGFLILMITCPDRICSGVEDHYYLIKIDAQGKTLSHLKIDLKESKCNAENGVILAKTFVDRRQSYCWIRLCHSHQHEDATLEFSANCHSQSDFLN